MWPTLASLVEERLRDDPEAIHAVVHALNRWMHDEWTFNYEDRIFSTPVITLPILDRAIEEFEWLVDHGARIILIRPAPVPGWKGPRSFALPEFDPFWKLVEESGVVVGMHASDSGYTRYMNEWEGYRDAEFFPFRTPSGFTTIVTGMHREIIDTIASAICRSRTAAAGCGRSSTTWNRPTSSIPACSTKTPSWCSSATSRSIPSMRRTRAG